MLKTSSFTVYHDLDLHDINIHIALGWEYTPGCPATYHDPEEFPSVEFVDVNVPDELHSRTF
jgi:hypothetical protein